MTAKEIQKALAEELLYNKKHRIVVPNTTRYSFELDVFSIDQKGREHEFEIKISASDFKADFKKSFKIYKNRKRQIIGKHEAMADPSLITEAKFKKVFCSKFWFVISEDIEDKVEIPDYAGLLVAVEREVTRGKRKGEKYIQIETRKQPKFLYKDVKEIDSERLAHLLSYKWLKNL